MKEIEFIGHTLKEIRQFPETVRREIGYQLDNVQRGHNPQHWKPMPSVGQGVREVKIHHKSQYRVIYIASFKDSVYVLHIFRKKTQRTAQQDIDHARKALVKLIARYQS